MGRVRIPIAPIADPYKRQRCAAQRSLGLLSKARQLQVLTGWTVNIAITNPNNGDIHTMPFAPLPPCRATYVADPTRRRYTGWVRTRSLLKKSRELQILTGWQVSVAVTRADGKIFTL